MSMLEICIDEIESVQAALARVRRLINWCQPEGYSKDCPQLCLTGPYQRPGKWSKNIEDYRIESYKIFELKNQMEFIRDKCNLSYIVWQNYLGKTEMQRQYKMQDFVGLNLVFSALYNVIIFFLKIFGCISKSKMS